MKAYIPFKFLAVILLLLCSQTIQAQSLPKYEWGFDFDLGPVVIHDGQVDKEGNIYIVGHFADSVDIDPSTDVFTLVSEVGLRGLGGFIVKLNSSQELLWAKSFVGTGNVTCNSVLVNDEGIYVVGHYQGTVDLNPGEDEYLVSNDGIGNNHPRDLFIMKLDTEGSFLWTHHYQTNSRNYSESIDLDSRGDFYLIGNFKDTVDFDPLSDLGMLTAQGTDIFQLKLDKSGSFRWVNKLGGVSEDYGYGFIIDEEDNLYTAGIFQSIVDFDPGPGTYKRVGSGAFVQKLNSDGQLQWATAAQSIGEYGLSWGHSVAHDSKGNVYLGGSFGGSVGFYSGDSIISIDEGFDDLLDEGFIFKFDKSGSACWGYHLGAEGAIVQHLVTDRADNLYVGSWFGGDLFLPDEDKMITNAGRSYTDILIQKRYSDGSPVWSSHIGGQKVDFVESIDIDSEGNTYLFGRFGDTLRSDLTDAYFVSPGPRLPDSFVFKISECSETDNEVLIVEQNDALMIENMESTYEFHWIDCSSGQVVSKQVVPQFDPPSSGSYAVEVVYSSGCTTLSPCYEYEFKEVVLSAQLPSIVIYPNPTMGDVTLTLPEYSAETLIVLKDLFGRVVSKHTTTERNLTIEMNLQKGMYLVEVLGEKTEIFKVIKY